MIRAVVACVGLVTACGSSRRAPEPIAAARPDAAMPSDALAIDAHSVATIDDSDVHSHVDGHDHESPLSCDELIADAARFEPVLAPDAPERDWNLAVRAHVLEEDCEHAWSGEARACLHAGNPCGAELPADLPERLGTLGELGASIANARKKPATIGCKQTVAAHYGDVRWQGKLVGFSARARAQMITDSRALMLKACTAEAWTDRTRACLVLGGADLCFFTTRIRRMWNYPADGSVRVLGIRECDDYDAAVTKLATCTKLPAITRDSLKRMADALKANIAAASPAERAKRAGSCQAALAPIEAIVRENGC
jgi:hypothetical protein